MKRDSEDVALSDGLGYMVARKRFNEYLDEASKQSKVPVVGRTDCPPSAPLCLMSYRSQPVMNIVRLPSRIMRRPIWMLRE